MGNNMTSENRPDEYNTILVEQSLAYLRDCQADMASLTKTVVTLNSVTLAAGGVFLRFSLSETLTLTGSGQAALIIAGLLVTLFGLVFNLGASRARTATQRRMQTVKDYLDSVLPETRSKRKFLDSVLDVRRGPVYTLTSVFFCVCSIIWILFGVLLVITGSGVL